MRNHLMVLPDGTELFSGGPGGAIMGLSLTRCVNSREELTLGSACAAMLEAKLLLPEDMYLPADRELILYQVDEAGVRRQEGIFVTQKPVRCGRHSVKLTAFDRMVYADRDLTGWLNGLTGWPYTLSQLAQMVCDEIGLELTGDPLPNGDLPVQAFEAADITGRELLQWIGEAAGRFSRIDPHGRLEFCWYTPAGRISLGPEFAWGIQTRCEAGQLTLALTGTATQEGVALSGEYLSAADDGMGNVTLIGPEQQYYLMDSLEMADYTVSPIEKVQIRASTRDVGTLWPDTEQPANTYIVQANPLLAAQSGDSLVRVAQTLYEQLHQVQYTPCKVSVPAGLDLEPGQILQITDSRGARADMYIMQKVRAGQHETLECTGAAHRETTTAVNDRYLKALSGKVLELRTDVDGLQVKNADAAGRTAQLELDVEGLRGRVSRQENGMTQLTQLQQDAASMELKIQTLEENAGRVITSTGYSFTEDGLQISKTGQEMKSLVDHTGLYVKRGGTTILQAGNRGVTAVDVTVGNYLIVGNHARFEDFEGGTACFYI
ncbi:MAG: hypothetical protein IJB02_02845 [Oscillospiraceae bacterium]|nr:hypothetical protein [Oscillospiraceae bacterium]